MSKFIIIVYFFITTILVFGTNVDESSCDNNIMKNTIPEEQVVENQVILNNSVYKQEVKTTVSNEIAKEDTTKEENINKSQSITQNKVIEKPKTENTSKSVENKEPKVEQKVEKTEVLDNSKKEPIKEESNSSPIIQEEIKSEEKQPIVEEIPKKNGYYYNVTESNFLVSEFKRLTNNSSSFTVRISESAKNSNPFYPYRESEINKKVYNATFGYFIVYAEDYYKDDVKQRTLYYITFDN